jgi:hypothetical protein
MLKTLRMIGTLACLLSLTARGGAQALPTATGPGRIQAGFGFSYAIPDFWIQQTNSDPQYQFQSIAGVSGFGDYDNFNRHLGIEGDFHCLALITALDRAELTYLVGPRITYPYRRFLLYGKALGGIRDLFIQEQQDNQGVQGGINFGFGFGGGVDIIYSQKYVIRAFDYERQSWPAYGNGTISPSVFTFGVAYRFH